MQPAEKQRRQIFGQWLKRYATAYHELQMVGSKPTAIEQDAALAFWKSELEEARKNLFIFVSHAPTT